MHQPDFAASRYELLRANCSDAQTRPWGRGGSPDVRRRISSLSESALLAFSRRPGFLDVWVKHDLKFGDLSRCGPSKAFCSSWEQDDRRGIFPDVGSANHSHDLKVGRIRFGTFVANLLFPNFLARPLSQQHAVAASLPPVRPPSAQHFETVDAKAARGPAVHQELPPGFLRRKKQYRSGLGLPRRCRAWR